MMRHNIFLHIIDRFKVSKILSFAFCFAIAILCFLQANSQQMPAFKMTLSNGKTFNSSELPKGKPLILIYFDPDCDHCQRLMDTLFKKINDFKKAELVMVTYKSVTDLPAFEKKHNTHNYANIKVGTEGTVFYLRNYFKLEIMPFTVLYDKKGNYVYSFRKETPVADLIRRVKALE